MNCKYVQSRLSAYVDRELSGPEVAEIRHHLSECDACRLDEAEVVALKSILGHASPVEPSEGFEDRLVAHVFGNRVPSAAPSAVPSVMPGRRTWAMAAAAACLAGAATLALLPALRGSEAPTASPSHSNDISVKIGSDQIATTSADPFSTPRIGVPVYYGR